MKMFKNLLVAGLAFASLSVSAQTADDIIAKNTEAMGGAAKLASLNTVKMSGTISAQGNEIPLTITRSQMKGMRLDIDFMGNSFYQVANAEKGSMFMPGMTDPKDMDPEMQRSFYAQSDLQGALYNYKEKGNMVEYAGMEKVEGADAYKLKFTGGKSKKVSYYFIDAKTNRLIKQSGKANMNGEEMDVETFYSDYKQNADGYWFPYTFTTPNGPVTYDKIETNVKVDDSIFKP